MSGVTSREFLWMGGEQIYGLGLSFIVSVLVVRHLGPEGTGAINYAGAIAGLLGPLATLGLESLIIRDFARAQGNRSEIRKTAARLLALATIPYVGILVCVAAMSDYGTSQSFALWAIAVSGISNLFAVDLWAFRAESRYREITKSRLIQMTLIQGVKFFLVFLNAPFVAFAAILAIEPILLAVTTAYLAKVRLPEYRSAASFSPATAKLLLHECWPLLLTGFGIMIYTRIDAIMIEKFGNLDQVGIYSAATRLSELWTMVPVLLGKVSYPRLAKLSVIDSASYRKAHVTLIATCCLLAFAICMILQVASKPLILFLYGVEFSEAIRPLQIHIWSSIPVFAGVIVSNSYQIFGAGKVLMVGCLVGSLSNVILNLIWIPRYGPTGAAAATAISYTMSVIAPILFSKKCREIASGKTTF